MKKNKKVGFGKFHFVEGGFDFLIKGTWYGIHTYWQNYPLFDLIHSHRKCNTVHQYGIIIFGLWIYIKINE